MVERLGARYDHRNLFDMHPLFLPDRRSRGAGAGAPSCFGSGDPTRAICSTLIAQAFQSVGYPILPRMKPQVGDDEKETADARAALSSFRHHSLFAPRDFDLSPYFAVVKPTIERGFDYRAVTWAGDEPPDAPAQAGAIVP